MNSRRALDFSGKTALVTGGGAGIGRAIAEGLGALGARVVIAEIDQPRANAIRAALDQAGIESLVSVTDVRKTAAVETLCRQIEQRFGTLDIVVNNVGDYLGMMRPFVRTTEADWDALYAINLRHLFIITRATLPLLRKHGRGGSMINLSTIEAFRGHPICPVYSAFKAGVTGFTKSMALQLAPEGIRVNAIAPETTATEQVNPVAFVNPNYREHIQRWIPLGRFGEPEDAAGCAIFLASDLSAWMTGTTLHLDGGALAAGGFYRTPNQRWTNLPVVSDDGVGPVN